MHDSDFKLSYYQYYNQYSYDRNEKKHDVINRILRLGVDKGTIT